MLILKKKEKVVDKPNDEATSTENTVDKTVGETAEEFTNSWDYWKDKNV